jgi:hypothetical protein
MMRLSIKLTETSLGTQTPVPRMQRFYKRHQRQRRQPYVQGLSNSEQPFIASGHSYRFLFRTETYVLNSTGEII